MSSTSINNSLAIVAPTPTASVVPSVDSKEFEHYLHQAATPATAAEKPAPKRETEAPPPEPAPESETVETSDQEQATTSEDQSDTNETASEQPAASETESASKEKETDDDQDEVVLSEAAAASQEGKPTPQDTGAEKAELVKDTATPDQDFKQSGSKAILKTDPVENNLDKKKLEEASDSEQVSTEKAQEPQVKSAEHISNAQAAENVVNPENKSPKHSRDAGASTATQDAHPQGVSEPSQEALPPGEKSKLDADTAAPLLPHAEIIAPDPGPRTPDLSSSVATAGPNSSHASTVQLVPPATQHRTETSSAPTGQETTVPTIDRGRFVQRVANAFRSAQQSDGEIQLRLSPPELGSLKIEIAVRHGVLTAKLEAETAHAKHTLLDNLPALRHRLAEQDIRIDKFEVDIRRDGGQGQSGTEDRQSRDGSNRGSTAQRSRRNTELEVASSLVPRAAMNLTPDSLDVRI